jgi:hypothetical protein
MLHAMPTSETGDLCARTTRDAAEHLRTNWQKDEAVSQHLYVIWGVEDSLSWAMRPLKDMVRLRDVAGLRNHRRAACGCAKVAWHIQTQSLSLLATPGTSQLPSPRASAHVRQCVHQRLRGLRKGKVLESGRG